MLLDHICRAVVTAERWQCRTMATAEHWQPGSCLMHCTACLLCLASHGGSQAAQQRRTAIVTHNGRKRLHCCCLLLCMSSTMKSLSRRKEYRLQGIAAKYLKMTMIQNCMNILLGLDTVEYSSLSVSTLLYPIKIGSVDAA